MSAAVLSADGLYRYRLTRTLDTYRDQASVLFVMLNPSTADATTDDPTIRRCVGFAHRDGFARLEVVNLHAYRATRPRDLHDAAAAGIDPHGPHNDRHLIDAASRHTGGPHRIVVAWGAQARPAAVDRFTNLLNPNVKLWCLGTTKTGQPRHPLMLRTDTPFEPWPRP